jgi:hypothetical protein
MPSNSWRTPKATVNSDEPLEFVVALVAAITDFGALG